MMSRCLELWSAFALVACVSACTATATDAPLVAGDQAVGSSGLTEVTNFGQNPGALKMYEHVPANLPANAPLVVVLHGCTQSAPDIAQAGWNELSDANGFALVYAEQQTGNSPVRCFSWAAAMGSPDDVVRGKGENESVHEMVLKATAAHGTDPKRVYVVGFSAGAAMAIVLAATWPDVFAGAASFAGIPFACASSNFSDVSGCMNPGKDKTAEDWANGARAAFPNYAGPWPRVSIWQGSTDNVVGPKNRIQLARQWSKVNGLPEAATQTETVDGQEHSIWKDASGAAKVETFTIKGMGHGIPVRPAAGCGKTGQYAFDKGICGAQRVASFFGILAHGQTQ